MSDPQTTGGPSRLKIRSFEVTEGPTRAPAARNASGDRNDRRGLGQTAGRGGLVLERSHTLQHVARPPGEAVQRGRPLRWRVPDRIHDHRGVRRHLDGPRGDAGVSRVARSDLRLDRDHDARGAIRRDGHVRGVRQVVAGHVDGRSEAGPARRVLVRRFDPSRSLPRSSPRHRERLRGRRRSRDREPERRRAFPHRAKCVPDSGCMCRDVHRQHHGVGRRGTRHVASRFCFRPGRGPSPRRSGAGLGRGRRKTARTWNPAASDHDKAGVS